METESRWDEPFYDAVREWMISLLSLLVLNMLSYLIIQTYRQRSETEESYADEEGSMAYRISLWMSVFTLSISIGAVLLLPVSIMMEEIYSSFRDNEYIGWLNPFLIQRLWNRVFICSNLCLFVLMPFAYFLTEAEGFSGWRKGIMSRVCETSVILILLALCTAVLTQLGIAFWSNRSPFIFLDHWSSYFEFLYSIISVLGVLLTLLCTPIGFTKMFSVVSSLLAKPQFLTDLDGDIHVLCLESDNVHKRLQDLNHKDNSEEIRKLRERAEQLAFQKRDIERQQSASAWQRNVFYPLTILYVLLLTAVTMIMVLVNILRLLVMEGALPVVSKDSFLARSPRSLMGRLMSVVELAITSYVVVASLTGFYSNPIFTQLQPVLHRTSVLKIIANCVIVLILSSAMPVLTRMLGLTRFDLVGYFGSFAWLGDLRVVLSYNLLFEIAMAITLTQKVTRSLMEDLQRICRKVGPHVKLK